jgi:hypothetical protein
VVALGVALGRSPNQRISPTVYKIHNFRINEWQQARDPNSLKKKENEGEEEEEDGGDEEEEMLLMLHLQQLQFSQVPVGSRIFSSPDRPDRL